MKYEDALKLLKNHYNWRITANLTHPNGARGVIVVEDERMLEMSEQQIIALALDIHQEPLFGDDE
jgi:hypothetical protein